MKKINLNFKTAMITGISGSGGSYLAEHILENHPEVNLTGLSRWRSGSSNKNLINIKSRIKIFECDLMDFSSTYNAIDAIRPDVIFHLAAHANVRSSFDTPLAVIDNNVMSTANLLEAIRSAKIDPVIQICSTSEVYGQVKPEDIPISEDSPLRPSSPYAVSKVTQDLLGYTYFQAYKMKIIRTRMFAYLNPRRADLFATSFARQVARIELGLQDTLLHGNLDSVRTLVDVRDAMRAYWDAVLYCNYGEAYNIGGDKIIKVGEFLDILKSKAKTQIISKIDNSLLRPSDVTLQIPSTKKFTDITGWSPFYSFEDSVVHLLEYWREREAKEFKNGR